MYVERYGEQWVYEMTWPTLRRTPADEWLGARKGRVWALPLKAPLDFEHDYRLCSWWHKRLGAWYDVPEMLSLGAYSWWVQMLKLTRLPASWARPAGAISGVCSVNCAWAWQAAGLDVPDPLSVTPASELTLPFVGQAVFMG
jgi:hypothetical protein